MRKKVIDILHPSQKDTFSSVEINDESVDDQFFIREDKTKRPKRSKTLFIILLFLGVIFLLIHFILVSADISIHPKVYDLKFTEKVIVDSKESKVDFNRKIIPAKIFEMEKVVSNKFNATGKVRKKAEGTIRLYNAFTTKSETWLKGTRFVSSEGKLFLSKDRILVPGAQFKDGKIIPSFVDVPVVAAQEGQEYNIEPSHFSLPAFLGSPRYTGFYGESTGSMTGGGEFPKVEKQDLDNAEKALLDTAKEEAVPELRKKMGKGVVFLDQALITIPLEKQSSTLEGSEVSMFDMTLKAKIKSIVYNTEDVLGFVQSVLSSQNASNRKIYLPSVNINYKIEEVDVEKEKMTIILDVAAKTYSDIDIQLLKKSLAGKTLKESFSLLSDYSEIDNYQVKIFPFWRKSLPSAIDKLNIKLLID